MSKNQLFKSIINDSIVKDLNEAIDQLSYGTIVITVHNKKITQIEIAEKKRFDDYWKIEEGGGI